MLHGVLTGRLLASGLGPAPRILCVARKFSDGPDGITPFISENKFPSPAAQAIKRGTGGRSSFNGTVCTVFGGGGLVGRAVVNRLGKIGTQCVIPYRGDPQEVRDLKLAGDLGQILFLPFYLRDDESIYRAMKYSNVVINLIGKESETASFTFDEVHVEGARKIARLAREAGVQRLIHVSSLGATPNPKPIVTLSGSNFLKSKYNGELAVREEFPDAIIFRPSDIYGEMDKFVDYWMNWYRRRRRKIYVWNKGHGVFKNPVFASDVAQGIVNSVFDNSSPGKTYDALGPRRYELHEIVKYMNNVTHSGEPCEYTIEDMRFAPSYWLQIFIKEQLSKYPTVSWEKIEKEMTSDNPTPGNPTLEDLGVKLTYFEQMAPFFLKSHNRLGYYDSDLGEFPAPEPPKYVPNYVN